MRHAFRIVAALRSALAGRRDLLLEYVALRHLSLDNIATSTKSLTLAWRLAILQPMRDALRTVAALRSALVVFRAGGATVGASNAKTLYDANGQPWSA